MFFIGTADVPYIPISEDRGFTALLIIKQVCDAHCGVIIVNKIVAYSIKNANDHLN